MRLDTTTEAHAPADAFTPAQRLGRHDYLALAALASAISILAFLHFLRSGEILLYGDAVAHINIARRLFDSRTPGLLQLGTVWLPLPHLLMSPLLVSDWAWRTGVGGSIPSLVAFVLACLGIFRLVRNGLEFMGAPSWSTRLASWTAALIFVANPNLLYLQATAMTESLSLALLIWATVFFGQFVQNLFAYSEFAPQPPTRDSRHPGRALQRCGWCLLGLMQTRYDGWFAAVLFAAAAALVLVVAARRRGVHPTHFLTHWKWKRPLLKFALLLAITPAAWLAYNAAVWGNPLEFANGPYSARGIERRTRHGGDPHHPGWHSPIVAAKYFVKAARLNLGEWRGGGSTFFPFALLGGVIVLLIAPSLRSWLLLWLPVPFYALSIAWGGVPIFIPQWWPFSYYNVRYGLQLLPAIAVFTAATLYFFLAAIRSRPWRVVAPALLLAMIAVCYAQAWMASPIFLREARANSYAKAILEWALAHQLRRLPPSATFLMYIGEHGGALQLAGIPLRRTINEGNYREWHRGLAAPATTADYVVSAAGDPLAQAVAAHPDGLETLATIRTPGQGLVTLYRSRVH